MGAPQNTSCCTEPYFLDTLNSRRIAPYTLKTFKTFLTYQTMAQITLNQPIAEIHGALSKPRPLFFAIVCSFTYGVPENARGVLGCLTNNIWVSLVLSRHLFCFCQWSGKYPCLYTLHPTPKKIALQGDFSCTIQIISIPLYDF